MGSVHSVPSLAPQQEFLPPLFTRSAASPYFCLTTSFKSIASVVVIYDSLPADLYDVLRFQGSVPCATLGIKKLQQFLQRLGIRAIPQKRPFPLYDYQVLRFEFVEMMRQG